MRLFQGALDTPLDSPFSATLSVHGLHFTVFRNAFSELSKRSEKECDERSLHRVPGPCSQARSFLLAELTNATPSNLDMKRLTLKTVTPLNKESRFLNFLFS